jgi:type VI secretion system protein ImpF
VPRTEIERSVLPSLLDRLTDLEPDLAGDPPTTREESARVFRMTVERDIERLLNTRRTADLAPDGCQELHHSAYEYGLPDTTGIAVSTKTGRDRLLQALQDTIARFEPRLTGVRVRLAEVGQVRAPQLRFVVDATLQMDPGGPEQVVFDTVLTVASGEYVVSDAPPAPAIQP